MIYMIYIYIYIYIREKQEKGPNTVFTILFLGVVQPLPSLSNLICPISLALITQVVFTIPKFVVH